MTAMFVNVVAKVIVVYVNETALTNKVHSIFLKAEFERRAGLRFVSLSLVEATMGQTHLINF